MANTIKVKSNQGWAAFHGFADAEDHCQEICETGDSCEVWDMTALPEGKFLGWFEATDRRNAAGSYLAEWIEADND